MIKILSAAQIREADAYTIAHEPVASIDLMERACRAFQSWFTSRFLITQKVGIVCGSGNNGGDGLGIARMLLDWGYPVKVWTVGGDKRTEDFTKNLARLNGRTEINEITSEGEGLFQDREILVDAIFGSGLSRPAEGIQAQAINSMNATTAIRVSVDIPSGLFSDHHSTGTIVKADYTVTFQLPRLAFLLPENYPFVGEWTPVDIGLSKKYIAGASVANYYLTRKGVGKKLKRRSKFDHKGDNGRGLLISGSYGKMGACILGARAALRCGIGLLTVHVPKAGYSILQTAAPEAMASIDLDEHVFTGVDSLDGFDIIGIGPGIGQDDRTADALEKVLGSGKPMVIDADALNLIAKKKGLLKKIPAGSILTPHPKEFERLAGSWSDDFERLGKQKKLAAETGAVIVLKGAHTSVATPQGNTYFNSTGNPGMATGGSGDVLTGMLTGLLAQGYTAEDTAIIGVYLHGLAGDLARLDKGVDSMIPSDLIEQIPAGFRKIANADRVSFGPPFFGGTQTISGS